VVKAGTDPADRPLVLVRATADEAAGAGLKVAGLTVVERALKQLFHLGHRVIVASDGNIGLPAGTTLEMVADPAAADALHAALGSPLLMPADLVRPNNRPLAQPTGRERDEFGTPPRAPGTVNGLRVTDEASRLRAEDAIFAELLRSDLGLVARHLNKPLSFRITRHLLCRLPVTPNQVTLGAAVIGLAGCALLTTGRPLAMFAGLLLAHLQSVLDGCDGELARVRFQQSAIGEWLDTLVDDGLNLALVVSLGIGVGRARDSGWPVVIGLVTFAMLLTYNAVTYAELIRQGDGGEILKVRWWFNRGSDLKELYGRGSSTTRGAIMALGRRDFFLLAWVVLAALGLYTVIQVYAVAVATPSFIGAVGQLVWRRRRG
jgi:phosphatidylglycerophosphate synthase